MKIYGNKQAVKRLSDYAKNNCLPHALLFSETQAQAKEPWRIILPCCIFALKRAALPV